MNQKPIQKLEYVLAADGSVAKQELPKSSEKRKNYYRERGETAHKSYNDSDLEVSAVTELDEELADV